MRRLLVVCLCLFLASCSCPSVVKQDKIDLEKEYSYGIKKLFGESLCIVKAVNLSGASAEKDFDSLNRVEIKYHLKKEGCHNIYLSEWPGEVYIYKHDLSYFMKYRYWIFSSDLRKCLDKSFIFSNFPKHVNDEILLFYIQRGEDLIVMHISYSDFKKEFIFKDK